MNFQKQYERTDYLDFFRDTLLPEDFDLAEESVDLAFKPDRITQVTKIGEVPSLDLPVFEIKHKSENDPRVTLSKEAFRILAGYGKQQALILFISTKAADFRLSLVTLELQLEGKKVTKEFSNPRRYSFFLGPQCKAHTPEQYLSKRIADLNDLRERFSIEVVNKEFFTQIAMRFTDLVGGSRKIGSKTYKQKGCIKYPGSDEQESKEFAVRLIGRLVFCWFLKKKHSEDNIPLVPENILSLKVVEDKGNSYHSVLEPLFFEVLNKKLEDRHENYKKCGWETIPFLNGGLFTPHNDDHYTPDNFQGLSPRGDLKVPDKWLAELLEIFELYNFTIDENTSVDIELSIDPEMLGRIFENLLAEINPETGETARKATGSYYTPRSIVEYMVDQSIKQYLLTQTNISEEKIDSLLEFSQDFADANLTDKQNDAVIEALDKLKVLDPACGSGAFPMGILQKMLLVLQKVDPDSKKWKNRLLDKIPNATARKALAEKLESETWQYIHKLGVIQSSIYGVDVQPIATEISKLRIFLSLIVDETVNDSKKNRGVEPLPNLKYKVVCGNSLIDKFMGRIIKTDSSLQTKSKKIVDKLTSLKADFFSAENEEEKVEYNLKILQSKLELADQLLADLRDANQFTDNLFGSEAQTKKQKKEKEKSIVNKLQAELLNKAIENARNDIDDLMAKPKIEPVEVEQLEAEHFKELFVWKLDFAEIFTDNNGFDIVIGNPPYGLLNKRQNKGEGIQVLPVELEYYKRNPEYEPAVEGMVNIFRIFILKSIYLLKPGGVFSEIFPLAFIADKSIRGLRRYIFENCRILSIEAFPERDSIKKRVFEAAKMSVCILHLTKEASSGNMFTVRINRDRYVDYTVNGCVLNYDTIKTIGRENLTIPLVSQDDIGILKAIYESPSLVLFSKIGHCYTGEVDMSFHSDYFTNDNSDATLHRGAIIDRYRLRDEMSQGEIIYLDSKRFLAENSGRRLSHHKKQRIAMQGITGVNEKIRLKMTLVPAGAFCANSVNYIIPKNDSIDLLFLLGLLNSSLLNYVFSRFSTNSNVNGYEVDNLPCIVGDSQTQLAVRSLVEYRLFIGCKNENFPANDITSTSISTEAIASYIEAVIDTCILELYFKDHFVKKKLNIIEYVSNELKPIMEEDEAGSRKQIIEFYKQINVPEHPIRNRLMRMTVDSPDIVGIILGKKNA